MPETGPLSVSVPGAVGGWGEALSRFGTISWEEALAPAVELATEGLPVSQRLSLDLAGQERKLRRDPEAAAIFLPSGAPPEEGSTIAMPDLAATLRRIQSQGPQEMYTGETGRRIARYLAERGGLLQESDLAAYEPEWTEPIRGEYHHLEVLAFPPNTQGVALLSELVILSHLDLRALGHNSADYFHTIAEAIRIAVTDRDSSVADPDAMVSPWRNCWTPIAWQAWRLESTPLASRRGPRQPPTTTTPTRCTSQVPTEMETSLPSSRSPR